MITYCQYDHYRETSTFLQPTLPSKISVKGEKHTKILQTNLEKGLMQFWPGSLQLHICESFLIGWVELYCIVPQYLWLKFQRDRHQARNLDNQCTLSCSRALFPDSEESHQQMTCQDQHSRWTHHTVHKLAMTELTVGNKIIVNKNINN